MRAKRYAELRIIVTFGSGSGNYTPKGIGLGKTKWHKLGALLFVS
jgi:hypothetical protein